ncbi:MAG TPA: hypothetical protein PL019_07110 [Caldisericia bacterium]|nr:hypothetical protein [Caldisericia bacterium]
MIPRFKADDFRLNSRGLAIRNVLLIILCVFVVGILLKSFIPQSPVNFIRFDKVSDHTLDGEFVGFATSFCKYPIIINGNKLKILEYNDINQIHSEIDFGDTITSYFKKDWFTDFTTKDRNWAESNYDEYILISIIGVITKSTDNTNRIHLYEVVVKQEYQDEMHHNPDYSISKAEINSYPVRFDVVSDFDDDMNITGFDKSNKCNVTYNINGEALEIEATHQAEYYRGESGYPNYPSLTSHNVIVWMYDSNSDSNKEDSDNRYYPKTFEINTNEYPSLVWGRETIFVRYGSYEDFIATNQSNEISLAFNYDNNSYLSKWYLLYRKRYVSIIPADKEIYIGENYAPLFGLDNRYSDGFRVLWKFNSEDNLSEVAILAHIDYRNQNYMFFENKQIPDKIKFAISINDYLYLVCESSIYKSEIPLTNLRRNKQYQVIEEK